MKEHQLLGRRVAFCPCAFCEKSYVEEHAPRAYGEIVTINRAHHTFTVAYEMCKLRFLETFHLTQLGREVTVRG